MITVVVYLAGYPSAAILQIESFPVICTWALLNVKILVKATFAAQVGPYPGLYCAQYYEDACSLALLHGRKVPSNFSIVIIPNLSI